MAYYKDLREYLKTLEDRGKLIRVRREINKDTELHPLVRLQFRGLPEEERKGWLFENVVDSKGKRYKSPVAVSVLAASRDVYAIGMACEPDQIASKWEQAVNHPIEPKFVKDGPVQEEVHVGDKLLEHGGLEEFPIPISTPGYDAGPYFTSPYWISKDPDTGVVNVGTYRAHVKSPIRTGIMAGSQNQHIAIHLAKSAAKGIPLQAAIVVGGPPNIGYVSVNRLPREVNELAYAGGIAGEPVEVVRCRTVDLEVPAHAEIVVEGELSTQELEPEAPFGEAYGLMGERSLMPYFTVKCITHRKDAIWQSFLSQFPPSESSKIRGIGREGVVRNYLRKEHSISEVIDIAMHESCGSCGLMVIRLGKTDQEKVWRALEEGSAYLGNAGLGSKVFVAVDEDIDPKDPDLVNWAIFTRVQPHRDVRIKKYPLGSIMDCSISDPAETERRGVHYAEQPIHSHLLINATMKWPYPPISLPKKEFMEKALRIWQEEGFPTLKLKWPWHGYSLGHWNEEQDEHAMLAVRGEYKQVGDILAQRRKKVK